MPKMLRMILRVLLLISFTCCVCGTFDVNVTQSSYQAEENQNITLEWTFTTTADTSPNDIFINCYTITDNMATVLFDLRGGVEVPESQGEQFAGRVRCDKDALREGRFRLQVSRVTTEDSGKYLCEVAANYDEHMRRWGLEHTERFVLNVTSDGENSDDFLTTAKSAEGVRSHLVALGPTIMLVIVLLVLCAAFKCQKQNVCHRETKQPVV